MPLVHSKSCAAVNFHGWRPKRLHHSQRMARNLSPRRFCWSQRERRALRENQSMLYGFATIANENLATSHKISEPKTCAKNNSSVLQLSEVCSSRGKGSAMMKLAWLAREHRLFRNSFFGRMLCLPCTAKLTKTKLAKVS
jgi:hypothetical protein